MHVAEPALERIFLEDRRGAGGKVCLLDDVHRGLTGIDRRHAQPDALLHGRRAGLRALPNLPPGFEEKRPRRGELRLHDADLRLHHGAVAQHRGLALGRLALRQRAEIVQHGARNAERDRRKARTEQLIDGEFVQRAVLAALRRIERVVIDGVIFRHQDVGQRIGVAAGALEPHHMPHVLEGRALARHDEGLLHRLAARVAALLAVGLVNETMRGKPGGVLAAAGKRPHPVDAIAALIGDRFGVVGRAPGQYAARIFLEHFLGDFRLHVPGNGAADRGLADAPGGRGIGLGDLLDGLHVVDRRDLVAAVGPRQQHAPKAGFVERVDQVGGQLAVGLDARGRCGNDRRQRAGIGDAIDFCPVIHARFPTSAGLSPAADYILPAATGWSIGVRGTATGPAAASGERRPE